LYRVYMVDRGQNGYIGVYMVVYGFTVLYRVYRVV